MSESPDTNLRDEIRQVVANGYNDWATVDKVMAVVEVRLRKAQADEQAWHDNYDGMTARWAKCDTERLALKDEVRDLRMKLRILDAPRPETRTVDTSRVPTTVPRQVPAAPDGESS